MIEHEEADVRTITMGISLLDCCDDDLQALNEKIYKRLLLMQRIWYLPARRLPETFGVPIVNKKANLCYPDCTGRRLRLQKNRRIFVTIARTLDKAAKRLA